MSDEMAVPAQENPTTVVPNGPDLAGKVVVTTPNVVVLRYQPVAAHIVGGGTSSVWPRGANNLHLPEGALLVSCMDEGTATSA